MLDRRAVRLTSLGLLAGLCLLAGTGVSRALHGMHPFHVCIGQMEWNAQSGLWELSLRLHPQDLERAITTARNAPTSLEDQDFADQATRYLNDQFMIVRLASRVELPDLIERLEKENPQGENAEDRSQLKWVGMEQERGWLWIHFEMVPPSGPLEGKRDWLVHRVFLDHIDRQENSVRIQPVKQRYSLQFKKGEPAQLMKEPMP